MASKQYNLYIKNEGSKKKSLKHAKPPEEK
jgi:hypothetical protein